MSEMLSVVDVRGAATMVGLTLTPDDLAAVRDLLNQWMPAAVELSTRMQAREIESLAPITAFTVSTATDPVSIGARGDALGPH